MSGELGDTRTAIEMLASEARKRQAMKTPILEALRGMVAGETDAVRRRQCLQLSRDIHNDRPLTLRASLPSDISQFDLLVSFAASWVTTSRVTDHLDAIANDTALDEFAVLRSWAQDAVVRQSIALSSPSMITALDRVLAAEKPAGRTTKSLPGLITYFARSTTKVSPFSRHTAVHVDVDGVDAIRGPRAADIHVTRSETTISRLLYRRLFRLLAADATYREHLGWKRSDLIHAPAHGGIKISRRRWLDGAGLLDTFSEDVVTLPDAPMWRLLLGLLPGGSSTSLDSVRRTLAAAVDDPAAAEQLTEKLVGLGVLVPVMPVSEQSDTFSSRWEDLLAALPPSAEALRRLHAETDSTRIQLRTLDGTTRAAMILKLRAAWRAALTTVDDGDAILDDPRAGVANVFLEDSFTDAGPTPVPDRTTWSEDFSALFPLLDATDDQRLIEAAVRSCFLAAYGEDGVCVDLHEFADRLREELPARMTDAVTASPSAELPLLRAAGATLIRRLIAEDEDQVEITVQDLRDLRELAEGAPRMRTASYAVFGQATGETLVLNHVYGGEAKFVGRFLADSDPETIDAARRYARSFHAPSTPALQIRPTLGFNANLAPALLDGDIAIPDEPADGDAAPISSLHLTLTSRGLALIDAQRGNEVDVAYLGFLVPHALPSMELLLASYRSTPHVSWAESTSVLVDGIRRDPRVIVRTPRVVFRSIVLLRRRWALRADQLLSMLDGSAAAFRAVNVWRVEHAIPEMVYVHRLRAPSHDPFSSDRAPKPAFVDFMSRLGVQHLAKRLVDHGDELLLEEFLPEPSSDTHHHATEIYFEVNDIKDQDHR
ncbi:MULTISPECIES: lantibiotic dehydratase [Clavibacter]|uniref:Lantibiotic dehydratase family protein n=1 Tax=Clavibacter seminis TaxID=2860285 RepID=A0ABY3TEW4_9MICO|nr:MULTISPECIES: lantibiotic dehydratase [Clavibacter]KDP89812.1 hypothetical protein W824_15065 [Clavibacter cf. michiganensis LMG 26808]UKF26705.1 lantibiotic dehydratase family protein [Clavibacter sp. A6099]